MENTLYTVTAPKKTYWIKGAKIRRISPWQKDGAFFTSAIEFGPCIWADKSEITKN